MPHYHAVVWLDHHEAHVLQFTQDEAEHTVVKSHGRERRIHHRSGSIGAGKAPQDREYFGGVADALQGAQEILVTGPAGAKLEFVKFLRAQRAALVGKVVAVETLDHPSDGQLLDYARRRFVAIDRMRVQTPD